MPLSHVQADISPEEIVAAAGQLELTDMDLLVDKLLVLRAQRRAPSLSVEESALLDEINKGIPSATRDRYETLLERRRNNLLNNDERSELESLTDFIEARDAERLERLSRLSRLQGVTLDVLLKSLGIQPLEYA